MRKKILIAVDDETGFRLKLKIHLIRCGFKTENKIYETAKEASSAFINSKRDGLDLHCVLVDYNLISSTINGVELIKRINTELGNGVPIFIISTSSGSIPYLGNDQELIGLTELEAAKKVGANGWIDKTSTNLELHLKKLNKLLDSKFDNKTFKIFK